MKAETPSQQQFIRTIELKDRNGRVVGQKEVVTYQGLLWKAHEEGLKAVRTSLVQTPNEENGRVAIARAEVETAKGLFQGYGDASPENVNPFIVPHLIRMAETRAKARALRDAVNVGVVSFEELDGEPLADSETGLGSGAPTTPSRPSRIARSGPGPRRVASPTPDPAPSPNGPAEPMSEAQRRYLFRLLAGKGLQSEAAHEWLIGELAVDSLAEVTKAQATSLIDRLLQSSPPQGGSPNGGRETLQR
jgi:hypothetical protein